MVVLERNRLPLEYGHDRFEFYSDIIDLRIFGSIE